MANRTAIKEWLIDRSLSYYKRNGYLKWSHIKSTHKFELFADRSVLLWWTLCENKYDFFFVEVFRCVIHHWRCHWCRCCCRRWVAKEKLQFVMWKKICRLLVSRSTSSLRKLTLKLGTLPSEHSVGPGGIYLAQTLIHWYMNILFPSTSIKIAKINKRLDTSGSWLFFLFVLFFRFK